MNLEVRRLLSVDEETLDKMTKWMYEWWGKKDGHSFDEVKCFIEHSMQDDKRIPQTYGLFLDIQIIGMYQFSYDDLIIRPDIYPWLANVYIDEQYRGKGYSNILLQSVRKNAKANTNFKELYLYTKHLGLYEKFGWKFISDFDTYSGEPRIQRLYKLDI